jgi:quercetin dioxygenase-like cupin family protein
VLASADDTGGAFEVFEMTALRDSGPPPHAHPWSESYSIIEGTVDVRIGDKSFSGSAGSFFQIPAGTFHSHRITSDRARMIVVTSPSGATDFFGDVDNETDVEKIVGAALKHGFTLPA